MAKDKKYDIKLNPDTATAEEIKKANEKLHQHLLDTGEMLAAKRVEGLMKEPEPKEQKQQQSPVYGKLLKVNTGILAVLKKIQEDMIDEQDTGFKVKQQETKTAVAAGVAGAGVGKKFRAGGTGSSGGSGGGFLDLLFGGLFSGGLSGFALKKLFGKGVDPKKNTKDIKKTKKDLDKTKKDVKKTKQDLDKTKKDVDRTKKDLDKTKKDLDAEKKKRKTRSDKGKKRGSRTDKPDPKKVESVDPEKKTVKTEKVDPDKPKVDPDKPKVDAEKPKAEKPKKKLKASKPKPKAPDASKLNKAVKNVPVKVLNKGGKTAVKAVAKGIAKSIPVVGALVTAGVAINDGIYGWNHADEILEMPKNEIDVYDKAGAAGAQMVSGVTYGLVDPKKVVAAGRKTKSAWSNTFGEGADVIDKYEALGIIDQKSWGDSEILNWKKLRNLHPDEIQKIIDINDWNDIQLKALKSNKKYAERKLLEKQKTRDAGIPEKTVGASEQPEIPNITMPSHSPTMPTSPQSAKEPNAVQLPRTGTTGATPDLDSGNVTSTGNIQEYIKRNEGLRLKPYQDTLGYPTIGYGHLIKPGEEHLYGGITREEADEMFEEDFKEHWAAAMKIPTFNEQPDEVQNVLADMTYNLGPKWWTKWPNTMRSLQNYDLRKVADGIENSRYYTQVGRRSRNNVNIIRNVAEPKQQFANVTKPSNKTQVQRTMAESPEVTEPQRKEFVPESNKEQKEQTVAALNQNLNQQTVTYETVTRTQQMANITQPLINTNINNQPEGYNERVLSTFSS